jgi:hypothetical protein
MKSELNLGLGVKYAVVLHGPEVVDTGLAKKVMDLLSEEGEVVVVMSGYTGVAAIVDAGLEEVVDISRMRKPSKELSGLSATNDILLLVNYAKSRDSAVSFGRIVYSRCRDEVTKPFLQIDSGILIDWNGRDEKAALHLAKELGLELLDVGADVSSAEVDAQGRRVHGVVPGENVWIDGVVVGRATSPEVWLRKGPDGLLSADGIQLKQTGVNRLGRFDLQKAHVRSGLTRRTKAMARVISSDKEGVYLIDHSAEDAIYRCRDASLAVTVGDDTSKIAGSLLFRFNVPIVAITDGDEDGISLEELKTKGSVVIRVRAGTDDIVGREVRLEMFHGGTRVGGRASPLRIADQVMRIAGDRLEWHKISR